MGATKAMRAIILSAGKGERLRPLTQTIPKPLLLVNGKALIEYHIEHLVTAGIREIVINVAYLGEKIIEKIGNGARYGADIAYSQEVEPLETGGGILKALPLLGDEPFIAVSADIYTDYSFYPLCRRQIQKAHLVLTDNPPYHPDGDFSFENNTLQNTGKHRLNFAGISLLSPSLFDNAPSGKFPLPFLLREAINKGLVTGEYFNGLWVNVGTAEIYQHLCANQL
jgi:N-acetyl-alpha-D-muramate 1-phosphate uridylyltransferase